MTTVTSDVAQRIAESAQPAIDAVFDALQEADYNVRHLSKKGKKLESVQGHEHTKFKTDLYRFFMFDQLSRSETELGGWELNRTIRMNSLILHKELQTIRLLHTRRRDVIPGAGRNQQRINYFSSDVAAMDPDTLIEKQELLLTWQCWAPGAPLRLVHTLTAGSYSTNPKIDFSCHMQRTDEDFSGYAFDNRGLADLEAYDANAYEASPTGTD